MIRRNKSSMLTNALLIYYLLSIIYICLLVIFKRENFLIQAFILLSCPFISLLFIYAMSKKKYSKNLLPDWLLSREQYDDLVFKSPNIEVETNIIPFNDALVLNDNKTKRRMLIDLLKGEFSTNIDALELALKSDDSETSHYAATAVQQAKSDLMKTMRKLEEEIDNAETDSRLLEDYRDILKQYIRIEFLDKQTRKRYMYTYLATLSKLIKLSPDSSKLNHMEKIDVAISLHEYREALEAANQFLAVFPDQEEAYFAAMNIHYVMKNSEGFNEIVGRLRGSEIRLSPDKLNQLRFWIQGDGNEQ